MLHDASSFITVWPLLPHPHSAPREYPDKGYVLHGKKKKKKAIAIATIFWTNATFLAWRMPVSQDNALEAVSVILSALFITAWLSIAEHLSNRP